MKALSEHIGKIIIYINLVRETITFFNDMMHKMERYINVLCSVMKHLILTQDDSTLVVTKYHGNLQSIIKFTKINPSTRYLL